MNQYCGPKASPIEPLMHSFLELEGLFSCEWCGETMEQVEAEQWQVKYGRLPVRQVVRREWSE